MNTPDTEWEKKFDEIYGDYLSGYFCCDGRECGCNGTNVKTEIFLYIQYLLSSHTTYWKERVRKEVRDAYEHAEIVRQRTLNEIRQAVEDDEPYGGAKECIYAILDRYQPDVEIVQNQETGEIITANGVPLTPTPITNEDNLK